MGVILRTVPTPEVCWPAHLGCKVHDGVDLLCLQHVADEVRALDVRLDELHTQVLNSCRLDVAQPSGTSLLCASGACGTGWHAARTLKLGASLQLSRLRLEAQ
jgi:hypothetical protein